jgi:hypothetical protein
MPQQGFGELFRGLLRPVGNGRDNRQEDVLGVKHAMRSLGRYAEPGYGMTGYLDRPLDDTIRNYQADRGVRVDGYMNPGGETERELDTDLTLLGGLRTGIGEAVDFVEDLGKRAATGLAEGRMRARKGLFDLARGAGRLVGLGDLGFDRASDHLGRYLSGRGGARVLSSKDVESEPALTNAERRNRTLFESRTFRAATDEQKLNELLRALPDGKSVKFTDQFETSAGLLDLARRPGTYFALGRTGVRSDGGFTARRKGDLITIEGEVAHRLDSRPKAENERGLVGDPYDFDFPQPGSVTASVLERWGQARPFEVTSERRQPVTARVRIGPSGQLTVERVRWGTIR